MNIAFPPALKGQFRAGRPLALQLVAKKAAAEVIAKRVDPIKREVLQGFDLREDRRLGLEGRKIEDPEQLYLCGDDAGCEAYFAACDKRLRELGLKPAAMPADHCPALVARADQIDAERAVIEFVCQVLQQAPGCEGLKPEFIWGEKRERLLEIGMGLILNA